MCAKRIGACLSQGTSNVYLGAMFRYAGAVSLISWEFRRVTIMLKMQSLHYNMVCFSQKQVYIL